MDAGVRKSIIGWRTLVLGWCLLLCPRLFAAAPKIGFSDAIFPELATSGQAVAMGNAYIGRVDNSAAAFYNPAGLGSFRGGFRFHFSNLHVEADKGLMQMAGGGPVDKAAKNITKSTSLENMRQLLLLSRGKFAYNRFQLMPNLTFRFVSLGFMYSKQTIATIGTNSNAPLEFAQRADYGPYAALNISLFGGIIKGGASAVLLTRKELIKEVKRDLPVGNPAQYQGRAVMVTAGGRITLPWTALPTFAGTVHNATAAPFTMGSGLGVPPKKVQTVDLGFSLTPQIGKITRIHLEANYKDATNKFKALSANRHLAFGVELDVARILFLRGGYTEGGATGGIGVRARRFNFDLSTYVAKIDSIENDGAADRRFSFTISYGI